MKVAEAMKIPYPARLNGEEHLLFRNHDDRVEYIRNNPTANYQALGMVAIALFRHHNEQDYIAISQIDDKGDESWIRDFDMPEWLTWLSAVALTPERQRMLTLANRQAGSFYSRYGWNPDVVIEDEPSEAETEVYIQHALHDLNASAGMPIEFLEGDE